MTRSSAPTKTLALTLAAGFFAAAAACAALQLPLRPGFDRWPHGMVVAYIASINGKEIAIRRHANETETFEFADDTVFCRFNRDGITSTRMPDAQYLNGLVGKSVPVTFKVVVKNKIRTVKMVWDGLPSQGSPLVYTQDYPNQRVTNYGGLEYSYPKKCK
jgi:hypothetical protein